MGIWYATREDVKSALDIKETAHSNAVVDRAIEAASRKVEKDTHRRFYPCVATRKVDWPNYQRTYAWKLYLDANEVITVTSLSSAGTVIASNQYFLRRPDNVDEAPYSVIEIDLSTSASFLSATTFQRQISITGTFGYSADLAAGGALSAAITTTSATSCNVTNSAAVGVGDLILVDSEYMTVTEKTSLATGQVCSDLTAMKSAVTITGITGGTIFVGETITVDSERMLVLDVTGTTVTVERATEGSVLAAHTGSPAVYAPRTLTVARGKAGTTAATHLISATVQKNVPPGPIAELVTAYALDALQQKQSAYSRTVGSGDNARNASGSALASLATQVYQEYTRVRFGTV